MFIRARDLIMGACALRAANEVTLYYGMSHSNPRSLLDGFGYLVFCAVIIYGVAAVYDLWTNNSRRVP